MSNDDPKTGAQGGASNDTATPFQPRKDDDSPLGSTDQHSQVDHNKDAGGKEPQKSEQQTAAAD